MINLTNFQVFQCRALSVPALSVEHSSIPASSFERSNVEHRPLFRLSLGLLYSNLCLSLCPTLPLPLPPLHLHLFYPPSPHSYYTPFYFTAAVVTLKPLILATCFAPCWPLSPS